MPLIQSFQIESWLLLSRRSWRPDRCEKCWNLVSHWCVTLMIGTPILGALLTDAFIGWWLVARALSLLSFSLHISEVLDTAGRSLLLWVRHPSFWCSCFSINVKSERARCRSGEITIQQWNYFVKEAYLETIWCPWIRGKYFYPDTSRAQVGYLWCICRASDPTEIGVVVRRYQLSSS